MSDFSHESALQLRQAIVDRDTWDESMPELSGFTRDGFVAIDSEDDIDFDEIPTATLARLGIIGPNDDSRYTAAFGRRINRRFPNLSEMFRKWPPNQRWDAAYVYDDYGQDSAFMRIGRAGTNALVFADYTISAMESFEPGQPPLCTATVEVVDRMPMRQLSIELGDQGGSMLDIARAIGIDPASGNPDPDRVEPTRYAEFRINLANEIGVPLSKSEIARLHQDDIVNDELHAAETQIQPLDTAELLAVAALARSIRTSVQF